MHGRECGGGGVVGILVKLEDVNKLRSWSSASGAIESLTGRFSQGMSVLPWDQKATCSRASMKGQRSPLGVRRQPGGSGQGKEGGPASPEGSESAQEVWPVSGLLGPEREERLPPWRWPGGQETHRPGENTGGLQAL